MKIILSFEKAYKEALESIQLKKNANAEVRNIEESRKLKILSEIEGNKRLLMDHRLSRKKREEIEKDQRFLRLMVKLQFEKRPHNWKPFKRVVEDERNNEIKQYVKNVLDVIGGFLDLLDDLRVRRKLDDHDEAVLTTLYRMWQPFQPIARMFDLNREIIRVLFQLTKRNSPESFQLKQRISIKPLVKRCVTKEEAIRVENSQEIMARGEPFWRLVPYVVEFSSTPRDLLDSLMMLSPFIPEDDREKVIVTLMSFFDSKGLKNIVLLPLYYGDFDLRDDIDAQIQIFATDADYGEFTRRWHGDEFSGFRKGDLIDFALIKLDKLFGKIGLAKGRDPEILRITNTMAASVVFRSASHVANRRRDVWRKKKWRNMRNLGKL